ncbi:MAG: sensor domain-containing protein [Trebonia sp.]
MHHLNPRRDPVRLALSKAPWASAWYLLCYLFIGTALCAVALTIAVAGAALGVTLAGLPVLIAAALTIRWCANAERARLHLVDDRPVTGRYRSPAEGGLLRNLRTRWTDPATWRDLAYLAGLFVPLVTLDCAVLAVWLTFLAGITIPVWYWAPWQTIHGVSYHGYQLGYFPNGPHGHGGWGLYIDSLPRALLVAAVCLVAFLLFNYVLVATARAHAFVARGLLGEQADPLKEAKEILSGPGPLSAAEAAGYPAH